VRDVGGAHPLKTTKTAQAEVEQIAAALGVPPHRLDPALLEKESVRALIDSESEPTPQQNSAVSQSPAKVAARAKVAATVFGKTSKDLGGGERIRPMKRGKGRRVR
jgi:hypothetical protein